MAHVLVAECQDKTRDSRQFIAHPGSRLVTNRRITFMSAGFFIQCLEGQVFMNVHINACLIINIWYTVKCQYILGFLLSRALEK